MPTDSTLPSRFRWTPEFKERMRKQRTVTAIFVFLITFTALCQFEFDMDTILAIFMFIGMATTMTGLCLYAFVKCFGADERTQEIKLEPAT